MPNSMISDKRTLFELLTKILDRGRKDRDAEVVTYVEQATELWTAMMMEEHDHDQKCIKNVHDMQDVCDAWLKELLSILEGGSAQSGMAGAKAMDISVELENEIKRLKGKVCYSLRLQWAGVSVNQLQCESTLNALHLLVLNTARRLKSKTHVSSKMRTPSNAAKKWNVTSQTH
jgi:hypothetical protein